MNIEKQIAQDHARFGKHYAEIIKREARHLLTFKQSSRAQDMEEGFDYVMDFTGCKVAVRNRKHYYWTRFKDVTIRAKTKYNNKTEIHKLREGFGDYYLYVWQAENGRSLYRYLILCLDSLRSSGLLDTERKLHDNRDGTGFYSFSIQELINADCIIVNTKF